MTASPRSVSIDIAKLQTMSVWYLGTPSAPKKIGRVSLIPRQTRCAFVYDPSWQTSGGFALSPDMPLDDGAGKVFLAPEHWSAPGALEDALPDRWGYQTIMSIDRPSRLTPLDLLYYAGDRRFGALGISPRSDQYLPFAFNPLPTRTSLEAANELIRQVIEKHPVAERDRLLLASSRTMGGARPKMLVDIDGEEWIAKFPKGEHVDLPMIEHASMRLAQKAGIRVAATRIHRISSGHVILVKRFDRQAGTRIHSLSARTMLLNTGEETYAAMADSLRQHGAFDIMDQHRQEIFSRMVFNMLIDNTDDHSKNHAFLRRADGHWELSPAYDVLPQMQGEGRQAMPIAANAPQDDLSNAIAHCAKFALRFDAAIDIWRNLSQILAQWRDHFSAAGVSAHDIEQLSIYIDSPEKLQLRSPDMLDQFVAAHKARGGRTRPNQNDRHRPG